MSAFEWVLCCLKPRKFPTGLAGKLSPIPRESFGLKVEVDIRLMFEGGEHQREFFGGLGEIGGGEGGVFL